MRPVTAVAVVVVAAVLTVPSAAFPAVLGYAGTLKLRRRLAV